MKSGDLVRVKRTSVFNQDFRELVLAQLRSDGTFAYIKAIRLLDRIGIVLRETGKDCVLRYETVSSNYNVAFGEDVIVSHEDYLEKIIKD